MTESQLDLVDPTRDPLVEVSVGVWFERLPLLRSAQIGLLWAEALRSQGFESVEERPPLDVPIEIDVPPSITALKPRVKVLDRPEVPRFLFTHSGGIELVQLQQDMISFHWRRREHYDYKRYAHMREQFLLNIERLQSFVGENKLGELSPVQAEITYVNHVFFKDPSQAHSRIGQVIRPWADYDLGGAELEDVAIRVRHRILSDDGKFLGRVHARVEPSFLVADGTPVYKIDLTGRGRPLEQPTVEGALGFIDLAHQRLRIAFENLIRAEVQARWMAEDRGDG